MQVNTAYFENPGKENTEAVLDITRQRAEERGIKTILVASTTGETAVKPRLFRRQPSPTQQIRHGNYRRYHRQHPAHLRSGNQGRL